MYHFYVWLLYFNICVIVQSLGDHNFALHREAEKKEPIFFCVHLFSTWQKLVIFSRVLGLIKVDL